jgi:hypothetical protein
MSNTSTQSQLKGRVKHIRFLAYAFLLCVWMCGTQVTYATQPSLYLTPATAVLPIGEPFVVEVRIDTDGGVVGTADAVVAYEPDDLSFVSFTSEGSVFSRILVDDTTNEGRVEVSGFVERNSPAYQGEDGLLVQLTFMPLRNVATQVRFARAAATPPLSLTASVGDLANILTELRSATYTLVPRETLPAQTLATTQASAQGPSDVSFEPSPNKEGWIATTSVKASWPLPKGVSAMRTEVSTSSTKTPSKTYQVPVTSSLFENLTDGEQYLLLQFAYDGVWDDTKAYPLRIDTTPPEEVLVEPVMLEDGRAGRGYTITAKDMHSGVREYKLAVDGGESSVWERPSDGIFVAPTSVSAGEHVLTLRVEDVAGNATTTDFLFTVAVIESPILTLAPERVLTGDTIVVEGTTYPNAEVTVYTSYNSADATQSLVRSRDDGTFIATVTDGARAGTYTVWFSVKDDTGAVSPMSLKRSVTVTQPVILLFGKQAVGYLSVIIPLVALILLLGLVLWLGYVYVRGYRGRVRRETQEAHDVVRGDFHALRENLVRQIGLLEKAQFSRELTREEMRIFTELSKQLDVIENHIAEEIEDIEYVREEERDAEEGAMVHNTLKKYQKSMANKETRVSSTPPSKTLRPDGHTLRIERVTK